MEAARPAAPSDLTVQTPVAGAAVAGQVFDYDALEDPSGPSRSGPAVVQRRRSRWPWVVAALAIVAALVAGGIVAASRAKVFTASHPVPVLTGLTVAQARHALEADHFSLAVSGTSHSTQVPAGTVISQSPRHGVEEKEGTTVSVVSSSGPPIVPIPALSGLGLDCAGATKLLATDHFVAKCPALEAYSATVPIGQVINWSYNGQLNATHAPYGSTIAVAVSKGKPPVPVPTLAAGSTFTQAQSALGALGLQATQVPQSSTTVPSGQVIATTPPAGATTPAGSTVKVNVSTGPPVVTVPSLSGDTVTEATAALTGVGLTVGQVYGPQGGHVFTSVPLAGQTAKKGSAVTLYTQ